MTIPAKSSGSRPAHLKGEILPILPFATASQRSTQYHPRKWLQVRVPWSWSGTVLFSNPQTHPPALNVRLKQRGLYRLSLGVGNGKGVNIQLPQMTAPMVRVAPPWKDQEWDLGPFVSFLSNRHQSREVHLGVVELTGTPLKIKAFGSSQKPTMLDYLRLEKLTAAQENAWRQRAEYKPCVELSGFADTPDLAVLTDADQPDPQVYRGNIIEHARQGFTKVFWRIDGQCSDFPSQCNTMRYISAKVHNVFAPHSKGYGRLLRKVDLLKLAVDAGRESGIEIWGWIRFNSYTGNVQSDFYKNNPEYWEESDSGYRGRKLCIALPEVRQHKIDILLEAAKYGLSGLQLGFLRHAPVMHYHPVLVLGFERKYGVKPPRYAQRSDANFNHELPPDDELHRQWYAYRAGFLTQFGRDLKAALTNAGLGHLPLSIWVRPNHCLFDGIDLPTWLEEGLCQEVVAQVPGGEELTTLKAHQLTEPWKAMVRSHAKLVREVSYLQPWDRFENEFTDMAAQDFDGLCTYESNQAVLDHRCVELYHSLRHPK